MQRGAIFLSTALGALLGGALAARAGQDASATAPAAATSPDPAAAGTAIAPADEAQGELAIEALEERGARIETITITVENVFDTTQPGEDKRLYRWANRLHRRTRPHVIDNILLFDEGETIDAQVLAETERLLRAQHFVADATVSASGFDAGRNAATVDVRVRDSWSLEPDLKLGRGGGENELGLGLTDDNLFGLGKSMTVRYEKDVDRTQREFSFSDPNLGGSRMRLGVGLADNSDGRRVAFSTGRPFFALSSRWALTGQTLDDERIEPMYDLGEIIDEFRHDTKRVSIEGGLSRGLIDSRTRRFIAGITYEEDLFQPAANRPPPLLLPADRKLVYPWFGIRIIKDDYREVTDLNDMGRTEDVALGLDFVASLGFASTGFGSDRNATILNLSAARGFEPGGAGHLLLLRSSVTARDESDGLANAALTLEGQYYKRNFEKGLLSVSLRTVLADALDYENQILLGGDNGLRGYPLRYQSGERSRLLTIEQRFFTDWYPFRLIRVGYAFFLDAGRVSGFDPRATSDLGTLYDVGVGLRISSPRASSRSIVHIDLAFPIDAPPDIDNVQLTIERKGSF